MPLIAERRGAAVVPAIGLLTSTKKPTLSPSFSERASGCVKSQGRPQFEIQLTIPSRPSLIDGNEVNGVLPHLDRRHAVLSVGAGIVVAGLDFETGELRS